MSLKEGKDNLAYKNYKMSDDFKSRMLNNYMEMLNSQNTVDGSSAKEVQNNVQNSVESEVNTMDSNIVSFDELEQRRNINLTKDNKKSYDGFIRVAVASFAIIASVGAVKLGMDAYGNRDKVNKKVAKETERKTSVFGKYEKSDSDDMTITEGVSKESIESMNDEELKKYPKLYPECYDENGKLLDGYEYHTLSFEYEGQKYSKILVGRDFIEMTNEEYVANYKESMLGAEPFNKDGFTYIYYLQGNKFLRTCANLEFSTECYAYKEIEDIKKINGKVMVFTKDRGVYGDRDKDPLPEDEFFMDFNMKTITKYAFIDGEDTEYKYMLDSSSRYDYEKDAEGNSKGILNLYFIDEENTLWVLEDVDDSTLRLKDASTTYTYKKGENYKEYELARNVKFDEKKRFASNDIYVEPLEGFSEDNIIKKDKGVKYKGIDY